jgi:hypothetical protein
VAAGRQQHLAARGVGWLPFLATVALFDLDELASDHRPDR